MTFAFRTVKINLRNVLLKLAALLIDDTSQTRTKQCIYPSYLLPGILVTSVTHLGGMGVAKQITGSRLCNMLISVILLYISFIRISILKWGPLFTDICHLSASGILFIMTKSDTCRTNTRKHAGISPPVNKPLRKRMKLSQCCISQSAVLPPGGDIVPLVSFSAS